MKRKIILNIFIWAFLILSFNGLTYADLNTGLVAYYPFDGNADDWSGRRNHGVVNGATCSSPHLNRTL